MKTVPTLDCVHLPSPHGDCTTGTAHTTEWSALWPAGREICWDCAYADTKACLLRDRSMVAYLSSDGTRIVDWPGGTLAVVTRLWTVRNNMAGTLSRVRAMDVHGQHWYGVGPGRGMYVRLHRVTGRARLGGSRHAPAS